MRILFGFMKIVMNPKNKLINYFLFLLGLLTISYAVDIQTSINKALKDSLVNLSDVDTKYINQPEYLFLSALIDTNGESSLEKYKNFYNKFPRNPYADNAVFEVGSYYYTKGYYVKSSKWYKKIPIYYHDSEFLEASVDMFFKTLEITNASDSISYYRNVFAKLHPSISNDKAPIEYKSKLEEKDSKYNVKYTIQIGAFKEYPRAEARMYMLRDIGFGVLIEEAMIDNEKFFVIREGIYSTKKSAEKIASRIKARTGIKCMIIEL